MRLIAVPLLVFGILLAATPSPAIEQCKARIDKKTGEIEVSAKNVVGTPHWGGGFPDFPSTPFQGLAGCQKNGRLKNCLLGEAGSYSAKRTPSSCTLSMRDDVGQCSTHIIGCSADSNLAANVFVNTTTHSITRAHGAVSVAKESTGSYDVRFDRAVHECFPMATRQSQDHIAACAHCGDTDHDIRVRLWNVNGQLDDFNGTFYLVLHCP